jgi:16S rRNA (cytosine967-C5)-methyltransferase
LNKSSLDFACRVISKVDREFPADAVLRTELKQARGVSREQGGEISRAVFAYYRWLGWLLKSQLLPGKIQRAVDLSSEFAGHPEKFSDGDLEKAVPAWVFEHVKKNPDWLRSLQAEPQIWLRARVGKGRELAQRLEATKPLGEGRLADCLRYNGQRDLFRTDEFQNGEFELQDVNSQAVGWICNPKPDETWWDACAGEGGKSLHLSDLMLNKGMLWVSDRAEWRLKKLKLRAARAKMFNYRATLWDGSAKLPTKTKFDGILLDAPCSGIGTWQRNPQSRWTATAQDVKELAELQARLLRNVVPALKPGGRLVYSVCSLAQAETVGVTEAFSREFPEMEPMEIQNPLNEQEKVSTGLWLWPQHTAGNGMFVFEWRRK